MEKKLTVGFDAKRIVRNASGLGAYSRTLVNDIIRCSRGGMNLLLYAPDRGLDSLRSQIDTGGARFVYPQGHPGRLRRDYWRARGVTAQLVADGVDLYHGLTGELPVGLRKAGVRGVVTIHDLIFMRHPEYYHWIDTRIYRWKFFNACREASRIIAISERTKADVVELGGVDPSKVDVIYQSCDPRFTGSVTAGLLAETAARYRLPRRFVLSVGTIERRKNVMLALRALCGLPSDVHLVVVGRRTPYAASVEREACALGLSQRLHVLCGVDDTHLQAIYRLAEAFVYPSRYEGFGIPVIEAIFSGLPVVACTGSFREEAGGPASLYVGPDDAGAMARALGQVLRGAPGREGRIRESQAYVERFRGASVAEQVMRVYATCCTPTRA